MFTITRSWLLAHRTPRGGYTRRQLTAIGVPWPPKTAWTRRVEGLRISDDARATFEQDGVIARVPDQTFVIDCEMMPTGKPFGGTLRCLRCDWGVLLAADSAAEATTELRAIGEAHQRERHR